MTTHELLLAAKAAAPALAWLGSEEKNAAILRMADAIDVLIPALAHAPTYVDLPMYEPQT